MKFIKLIETLKSKENNVIKYIFLTDDNQITEYSYINKHDGKDIICVPSQTACNLGCKFCHLSDIENIKVRNLKSEEVIESIKIIIDDLKLLDNCNTPNDKTLLISFMGAGEPLLNTYNLITVMNRIKQKYENDYKVVRFAIATLIPKIEKMIDFIDMIKLSELNCKFHFSLHFTNNKQRKEFMPASSDIRNSLALLEHYTLHTGNKAEIHYTLIKDVNDSNQDIDNLLHLVYGRGIPIKFLHYNEKKTLNCFTSDRISQFTKVLEDNDIETEFYIPPGRDIGSSCGMFLVDLYKKYNINN